MFTVNQWAERSYCVTGEHPFRHLVSATRTYCESTRVDRSSRFSFGSSESLFFDILVSKHIFSKTKTNKKTDDSFPETHS